MKLDRPIFLLLTKLIRPSISLNSGRIFDFYLKINFSKKNSVGPRGEIRGYTNFGMKIFGDEKFRNEKFRNEKFRNEKFRDEKFRNEKFRDEKFQGFQVKMVIFGVKYRSN